MACKGVCIRYKAKKPVIGGRYESGQMRCQVCEMYVTWEGLWCPCCGYRMRGNPRNIKYKAKLRIAKKTKKIEVKPKLEKKPKVKAKRKPKVKSFHDDDITPI